MGYVIKGTFQSAMVSVVARFAPALGSVFMQLTEEIAECYRHASRCIERARRAIDAGAERDFLEMERSWLSLARSYEFAERLAAI